MDWILEEVIDSMEARIQALENVTKDTEVKDIYKFAKLDEIDFLREQLKEIEDMKQEEIKQFELVEEDLREKRYEAYI